MHPSTHSFLAGLNRSGLKFNWIESNFTFSSLNGTAEDCCAGKGSFRPE